MNIFSINIFRPIWVFTIAFILSTVHADNGDVRVVCYYTNWSVYRPGTAKFTPQNINPYLCTHLIYAFGGFTKENQLRPFDKYQDIEKGGYAKFTGLKTYNKKLKTLLAVGGWNEGSTRFSPLVASADRRAQFVRNAVKFLRINHFDGLDLDWEYPAYRDGGKPRDRDNYAQLVQELRQEFERESEKTGRPRLLLTMAVPAGIEYIDKGYDIPKLNRYLDWMNILSYDYHSAFEPSVNHHAPLYPLEEDNEYNYDVDLNIDHTIKHYLESGADRDKLVLGIPTYGRSYTLLNPDATEIGSPADGPGEMGDATREKGYLAYYEICERLKSSPNEWEVVHPNARAMGPYTFSDTQWVGYDDAEAVRRKAEYVAEHRLGGIMFWALDNDDFRGNCHDRPYPLIEAAKEALLQSLGTSDNQISSVSRSKTRSRSRNRQTSSNAIGRTINSGGRQGYNSRNQNKVDDEEEERPSSRRRTPAVSAQEDTRKRGGNKRRPSGRRTTTTTTTTTPKSVATPAYNTPEPPTTPDPGSDFKCEEEGFYPHPRDCKKYFWCLSSGPSDLGIVAHQFTCPSGLYFNKAADSCDYTRNVLCNKKKTTTTTTTTTSTTPPSTTTPARTTARAPPRITAATSRTTFRYSATSTTEAPEEDYEYDDDEIESNRDDDNLFDSEEDPRVIKELIDLIKKVGGIEELEKQLQLQEQGISSTGSSSVNTTPPTISRSLYERVLNGRATSKLVSFTSKPSLRQSSNVKYSSINRNSRPGPQNEGLESTVEVQSKPQYVTISRSRPQSPDPSPEDEAKLEAEEISSRQRYEPAQKPQYVTIRRPKIPSENLEEVSSPLPNQQEIDDISNESDDDITTKTVRATATPEYVTIRRTRPSTEETSTSRYTNIQRSRGTTTETAETSPIVTEISDPSTLLTDITSPSTKYTSVTPVFERTSTEAKEYLNVAIQSPVSLSQPENFDTSTIIDDLLKPLLNVAEVETTVGVEITTPTESATPSTSDITRTTPVLLQPRPFAFNKRTRPSSVKSTTTETNDVKSTTDKVSLRAGSGDFNAVRLRKPGVGLGTRLAGSNFEETDENDVISSTNGRRGNSRFRVPNGSLTNQIPAEVQYTAINRARPAQNIDESEVSEETPRYRPRQTIVRRRPYQNNDQVRNIETNSDPIVSRTQTGNQRKYIRRRPIENPEEQEEVFDNVETERPVRRNRPNYNQQRTNNNEAPQQQKERKYRPTSGFDDLSSLTAVDFELQRGKKFGGNSRRIYPTRQRTSTQNVQQTSPVTFESTTVDARTSYKRPTPRTYTEEYFDITNRNDNRFPVSDSDVLTADDLTTDEPDMTTKIYKTLVAKFAIGGNNNRVQERKSPNGYRILPNSHPVFSSSTPYQPITEGLSEEDSEHISVLVDEHYDDFKTSTLTPSPSTITTETTRTTKTRRFPTRRYGNRNSIETNTNDITKNQRTTSRGGSRSLYNPRGTRVEDENVLEEKNDTKIETVRRRRPTNRGKPFIENGRNILDETKTADNEDDETISKTTINNITDLDDENVTDNIKQTSETTISTPRKRVVLRIPKRRTTTTTEQINSEEDLITTKVTNEPTVSTTPSSNRKRIIIKKKRTKPVSTTVSLDEISSTSTESLDDYKLTSEIDRMDIKKETSAETSKYESVTESTTIESEINENENSTELGILEKETIQQNETETTTSSTAKSTESTTKPIRKITRRPGSYRPRRPFTTGSSTTESIVSTRRRPYGRRPGGFRQTSTLRTTESNEGFSRASFRPSFTRPSTVRTPIEEEVIEKNKNLDLEINKENNDDDDDDDENSNDDDNNDESNIEVEDKEVEDKQVEDKDIEDKEDEKLDDSNDNDEEDALEETPDYEIDLEVETSKSTPRPSTPTRVINRPYFKSSGQTTTTRRYQPRFKTNKPTTESPSSRFSGINRPDNSRKQTLFTPRRKNIPVGASSTTSTEKPTSEEDSTTPGTTDQTTSSLLYHIFAEIEGDTTESSASKISLNGVTGITRHYNMSKEGETTTSFPIYVPSETTPHLQSSTQKENDTENEIFGNRKLEKLVEVNRITGDVSITDEHMKSNASEMKIVFDHKVDKFDKLGEVNRLTVIKIVGGELFNDNERSSSVNPNIATDSSSPSKTKTTEILITSDSPRTESIVKKLSTASSPNTDSSTLKAETKTTEFDIFSQTNPPRITFFPLLPIEQEFLLGEKEPRKIVIDSYSRVSNAIAGVPEVLNTETSTLSLEGLFKNNEPTQPTIATTSSTEPTTSATTTINHNATEGTTIDTTKTASTEAQTLPTLKQLITDNTPLVKIKVLEQDPKLHVKEISFLENPVTIPVRILQEEAESTTARKQESEEPLSIIPLTTVEKVTENNIGSSTANSEASQSKRHALDKSDPAVVYPANPIRVKYELMGGFLRADKSEVAITTTLEPSVPSSIRTPFLRRPSRRPGAVTRPQTASTTAQPPTSSTSRKPRPTRIIFRKYRPRSQSTTSKALDDNTTIISTTIKPVVNRYNYASRRPNLRTTTTTTTTTTTPSSVKNQIVEDDNDQSLESTNQRPMSHNEDDTTQLAEIAFALHDIQSAPLPTLERGGDRYRYQQTVTPTVFTETTPKQRQKIRIHSTTISPITIFTSAPIVRRRRPERPEPFAKVTAATSSRTYRPIIDYDYYDDGDARIIKKGPIKGKVLIHPSGKIQCLDQGNFPHPVSCKKFISCAKMESGAVIGWEYTCPKNLSFDPVGGICNWSAGLGCKE